MVNFSCTELQLFYDKKSEVNSMDTVQNCLYIGLGGALGAVFRYLFGLLPFRHSSGFPLTTFIVNVLGAFCIGLIVALAAKNMITDPHVILFLKTGICGGFTTFSTFSLESSQLLKDGRAPVGMLYIAVSVVLCIAAVMLAQLLVDLRV